MTTAGKLVDDGLRPCPISDPENDFYDPEVHDEVVLCEVERDGDHEYFECEDCGFSFGHRQAEEVGGARLTVSDDNCQAGVPEQIRRRASGSAMEPPKTTVPLGLNIPLGPPKD